MINNEYVSDSNIFSPSSWPGSVSSTLDTFYSSVVIKYCLVLFINAEFTKSVGISPPNYQVFISRNFACNRILDGKGNEIAIVEILYWTYRSGVFFCKNFAPGSIWWGVHGQWYSTLIEIILPLSFHLPLRSISHWAISKRDVKYILVKFQIRLKPIDI